MTKCIAIRDINSKAPVHVLVIPKTVIPRLGEATAMHDMLLSVICFSRRLRSPDARDSQETGYRVVINHGCTCRRKRAPSSCSSSRRPPDELAARLDRVRYQPANGRTRPSQSRWSPES